MGTVNGVVLSFTEGAPGNNATATENGNNYHITGNASGVDNAGQQVNQPFTVDVTCLQKGGGSSGSGGRNRMWSTRPWAAATA